LQLKSTTYTYVMGRECQSAACSNNYNNNGNIVSTLEAESDVPAVAK